MKLQEPYMFTGMQRDMSVSKQPAQFLYNGRNIRITSREGDTLLSITNERSTKVVKGMNEVTIEIAGIYLGHALLNQFLVIFSVGTGKDDNRDYIYRIDLSSNPVSLTPLYDSSREGSGRLYFSRDYPIEAIASYENENVQKVYWTDNFNQPRMINIAPNVVTYSTYTSARQFDFVPELSLKESVTVKKLFGAGGEFPAGVIQYCFTYYNKYGHESNIFYTTPLYYISPKDRGGAPDEKVDNVFRITVGNIDITYFEYLRVYSIIRTSLNGTPFCKRVQDVYIKNLNSTSVTITDTGLMGDTVDPTELLYKGGEPIKVGTLEQKDNTLFLGNIALDRKKVNNFSSNDVTIEQGGNAGTRSIRIDHNSSPYIYSSQLSANDGSNVNSPNTVNCAGFKYGDVYRLGVQFQHKSGRWSDPIYIKDEDVKTRPSYNHTNNTTYADIKLPVFQGTISANKVQNLWEQGYRRVRALVVFPNMHDRNVVCQGVVNPTLKTVNSAYNQSSWFFRPSYSNSQSVVPVAAPMSTPFFAASGPLVYTSEASSYNPEPGIHQVEIQGDYDTNNKFNIDSYLCTLHSPDIEFDEQLYSTSFDGLKYRKVGNVSFINTLSDILIQTETPTISEDGNGFIHKSFNGSNARGIVAGLFYDDYIVSNRNTESSSNSFNRYLPQKASAKWLVYPWQKDGSLNNDIERPAEGGVASSVLHKKIISNLRYATTAYVTTNNKYDFSNKPVLFSSDEVTIAKVGDSIYQGNIDTVLSPDNSSGVYFAWAGGHNGTDYGTPSANQTSVDDTNNWFRTNISGEDTERNKHFWYFKDNGWNVTGIDPSDIAAKYTDLAMKKGLIRMKYKSTPHIVCYFPQLPENHFYSNDYTLPIVEMIKDSVSERFGSWNKDSNNKETTPTEDALKANVWIPCGNPVVLSRSDNGVYNDTTFVYQWGDTYFQRYDCLKTYPFTEDDVNQIVEIGSFMLETHVNIDGRYDKNRGQLSNLYMRPRNFNLINPVYSQLNNFFTYRIMDDKFYENNSFPNQITWTKEKQSGADVDLWTNITLASTYDMDGSKGGVVSLNTWKDNIYCFQKKGVSNILFNSRVQIPTSDGVPIEISNNYKVDGYRYLSDGIGCNSPRLIKETPTGIYFIDSVSNHLFQIGDGINNITQSHNMSSVFRGMVFDKMLYDDVNRDLYLVNNTEALCYSEVMGQFTGFMDYGGASLIESYDKKVFGLHNTTLYELFAGDGYCNLFGVNRPWGLTFVSNGTGNNTTTLDKTFTNLEFRASVEGDGEYDENTGKFTFTLPFDSLEVWDEHQHGKTVLKDVNNMAKPMSHFEDEGSSLRRKFRIWRCDIPRNNAPIESDEGLPNLFRKICKPLDRMRNPWLYVKLQKDAATEGQLEGTELHDIVMTYYS